MSRLGREQVSGSQPARLPFLRALLIFVGLKTAVIVGLLVGLYFVVVPFEPRPHVAGGPGDLVGLAYILATRYVGVPAAGVGVIVSLIGLALETIAAGDNCSSC